MLCIGLLYESPLVGALWMGPLWMGPFCVRRLMCPVCPCVLISRVPRGARLPEDPATNQVVSSRATVKAVRQRENAELATEYHDKLVGFHKVSFLRAALRAPLSTNTRCVVFPSPRLF